MSIITYPLDGPTYSAEDAATYGNHSMQPRNVKAGLKNGHKGLENQRLDASHLLNCPKRHGEDCGNCGTFGFFENRG